MSSGFKVFLKSLPVLLSFLGFEFIVYFLLLVSFNNDVSSVWFFVHYPLFIRIPLGIAFVISFISLIKAHDHKYVFLAICLNVAFVVLFFEIYIFKTMRNPLLTARDFLAELWSNILFFFRMVSK